MKLTEKSPLFTRAGDGSRVRQAITECKRKYYRKRVVSVQRKSLPPQQRGHDIVDFLAVGPALEFGHELLHHLAAVAGAGSAQRLDDFPHRRPHPITGHLPG